MSSIDSDDTGAKTFGRPFLSRRKEGWAKPGRRHGDHPQSSTPLDRRGGTMRRWLLRFGYSGLSFGGWARQPGIRTVEGVLLSALRRRGIGSTPAETHLEVASRTDRGVSARGNALILSTPIDGDSLLKRLNSISPEIFFTAASEVTSDFRVRNASRRVYRYHDPGETSDEGHWRQAAGRFHGEVDVRSFGRGIAPQSPPRRRIESVTVSFVPGGRVIEVCAPSFVWGMVRKIVGALHEVTAGRLSIEQLDSAISGEERLTLPLAPAEGLVLWSVEYPRLTWEVEWRGPNRRQSLFSRALHEGAWRTSVVSDAVFAPFGRGAVGTAAAPSPKSRT